MLHLPLPVLSPVGTPTAGPASSTGLPSVHCSHPEPHTRLPGGRFDPPLNLGGNVEEITACRMVSSVQIH